MPSSGWNVCLSLSCVFYHFSVERFPILLLGRCRWKHVPSSQPHLTWVRSSNSHESVQMAPLVPFLQSLAPSALLPNRTTLWVTPPKARLSPCPLSWEGHCGALPGQRGKPGLLYPLRDGAETTGRPHPRVPQPRIQPTMIKKQF